MLQHTLTMSLLLSSLLSEDIGTIEVLLLLLLLLMLSIVGHLNEAEITIDDYLRQNYWTPELTFKLFANGCLQNGIQILLSRH